MYIICTHHPKLNSCEGQQHTPLSLCPFGMGHGCLVQGDVIWLQELFASEPIGSMYGIFVYQKFGLNLW